MASPLPSNLPSASVAVRVPPPLAPLFTVPWSSCCIGVERTAAQRSPPPPPPPPAVSSGANLSSTAIMHSNAVDADYTTHSNISLIRDDRSPSSPSSSLSTRQPHMSVYRGTATVQLPAGGAPATLGLPNAHQREQQQIPVILKCIDMASLKSASADSLPPLQLIRELHHSLKLEWLLFHHHSNLSLQASRAGAAGLNGKAPVSLAASHFKLATSNDPVVPSPPSVAEIQSGSVRPIHPSLPAHYRLGLLGPLGFPRWAVTGPSIQAPSLQATTDPTDPAWSRVAASTLAAAASYSPSPLPVMRSTNIHSGRLISSDRQERHARTSSTRSNLLGGTPSPDAASSASSLTIPFTDMAPHGGLNESPDFGGWPTDSQLQCSLDRASLTLVLPDVGGESLDRLIAQRLFTDVPAPSPASLSTPPDASNPIAPTLNLRLMNFLRCALAIVDQLCALHSMGIINKAVCPSAISYNPTLHIAQFLDFSQATLLAKENMTVSWVGSNVSGGGGAMLHVPPHMYAYMAPEESGRVSRLVDARADIYQFGMTMFEMIVGRPAFTASTTANNETGTAGAASGALPSVAEDSPLTAEEDVMAIIHAHLAREPLFPSHMHGSKSNVSVDITDSAAAEATAAPSQAESISVQVGLSAFGLVKKIILMCLSKMVEERYSSTAGLRADLLYALGLLQGKAPQASFKVGHMDRHSTFQVSQKLYGRELQQAAMLECFARAARSGAPRSSHGTSSSSSGSKKDSVSKHHHAFVGPQILLVSGYSGLGKTALVEVMHRPMLLRSAIYSKAKFDLYRRSHSAIFLAFDALFAHFAVAQDNSNAAAADANNIMMSDAARSKLVHGNAATTSPLEPTLNSTQSSSNWKRLLVAALTPQQLLMLIAVMPNLALLVGLERTATASAKDSHRALRIELTNGGDLNLDDLQQNSASTDADAEDVAHSSSTVDAASAIVPSSELAPVEAQNLFVGAFLTLVSVFATPQHPLVLFLDDVQWIDSVSLELLKKLYSHLKLTMMIVCAYRSNEVDADHSFIRMIQSLCEMDRTEDSVNADIAAVVAADHSSSSGENKSTKEDLTHEAQASSASQSHSSATGSSPSSQQRHVSIKLSPRIHQLHLPPLTKEHVELMIKDTAGIMDELVNGDAPVGSPFSPSAVSSHSASPSSDDVQALAELLHEQTSGNPFFIANLLLAYVDEGLISFDFSKLKWAWDVTQLRVTKLAHLDSVIDLLCGVVEQLSAKHKILLQRASCVGFSVTLQQLSIISETSEVDTAQHIWHLCQLGFLVPLQPASVFFAVATRGTASSHHTAPASADLPPPALLVTSSAPSLNSSPSSSFAATPATSSSPVHPLLSFRFLHDAVQQSCYQLMSPVEAKLTHLRIARLFDAQGSSLPTLPMHAQLSPKYTQPFLLAQLAQKQSQHPSIPLHLHFTLGPVSQTVEWTQLVYDIVEQYNLPAREYLQKSQQQVPSTPVAASLPNSSHRKSGSSLANLLSSPLCTPYELKRIMELNLIAGTIAKTATAYSHALKYLTQAHELWTHLNNNWPSSSSDSTGRDSLWTTDHELSLELHVHFIQCLTMNDLFSRAESLSNYALKHVDSDVYPVSERVRILRTQVSMFILQQSRTRDSLAVGLQILPLLGIDLSSASAVESQALRNKDPSIFLDPQASPLIRDPVLIDSMDILVSLLAPCFQLGELFVMERVLIQLLSFSYAAGVHASTAFVLVMKMYFDWKEGKMSDSRLSGRVSQQLVNERMDLRASSSAYMRIRVISLYYHFNHWFEPIASMLPSMFNCVTEGVACGETEYAGYCLWIWIYLRCYRGEPMSALTRSLKSLRASLLKQRRHLHASYCHYALRMVLHLQTAPVFKIKHSSAPVEVADAINREAGVRDSATGVHFAVASGSSGIRESEPATPLSPSTLASALQSASPVQFLESPSPQKSPGSASSSISVGIGSPHHRHAPANPSLDDELEGVTSTFEFNGRVFRDQDVEAFLIAGSSSTWLCHLYELYMIYATMHRCWNNAWEERERARPLLAAMAGMYDHCINNFYGSLILLSAVDLSSVINKKSAADAVVNPEQQVAFDGSISTAALSPHSDVSTAATASSTSSSTSSQPFQIDPSTQKPVQLGTWTSALPPLDIDYAAVFSYDSVLLAVESNQKNLHLWSTYCPSNFQHKYDLICAELMRIRYIAEEKHELLLDIMYKYDAAIHGAKANGFLHEAAMSNECAGRFYLALKPHPRMKEAKRYITAALRGYSKWNCVLKVELLRREFSFLKADERSDAVIMNTAAMVKNGKSKMRMPMLHPTPEFMSSNHIAVSQERISQHRPGSPVDRAAARASRRRRDHSDPISPLGLTPTRFTPHTTSSTGADASGVDRDKARSARRSNHASSQARNAITALPLTEQAEAGSLTSDREIRPTDGTSSDNDAIEPADDAGKASNEDSNEDEPESVNAAFGRAMNLQPVPGSPRVGGGGSLTSVTSSEHSTLRRARLSGGGLTSGGHSVDSPISTADLKKSGDRYGLSPISPSGYTTSESITRQHRRHSSRMDTSGKDGSGVDINLLSVMRATQAFSVITDLKLLRETLLCIVLQASCASRARLILREEAPLTSASGAVPQGAPSNGSNHTERSDGGATEEEKRPFVPRMCASLAEEGSSSLRIGARHAVTDPPSFIPGSPPEPSQERSVEHEHIYVEELSGASRDLGSFLPLSVHKMALSTRSAVLLNFDDIASENGMFSHDPYFLKFRAVNNASTTASQSLSRVRSIELGGLPEFSGGDGGDAAQFSSVLFDIPQSPSSSFGSAAGSGTRDTGGSSSHTVRSSSSSVALGWRGPRSCLCIPMLRQGLVIGMLYFEHDHYARDGFSTKHIQLLQVVGAQAVLSMDNARLYSRMKLAMEEAESGSRSKTSFLQNMSHEIRTPLNAMLGAASMLSDFDIPPEQMQLVDMLQSSGQLLLSIISDILDLSRIESGGLTMEQRPFRLSQTLEDVVHMLFAFAQQRHLDLTLHLDSSTGGETSAAQELPDSFIGDSIHLQQIMINLVNNALKFTQQGGVMIHVQMISFDMALEDSRNHTNGEMPVQQKQHSAGTATSPAAAAAATVVARRATSDGSSSPAPPVWLRLSVRDTGIGVAPSVIPKLFSSFVQADASTMRRFGGSGLGLAISKRLVNAMGGIIWMDSIEGKGTCVQLDIPFALVTAGTPIPTPAASLTHPSRSLAPRQISVGNSPLVNSAVLAMRSLEGSALGMPLNSPGSTLKSHSKHNSPILPSALISTTSPPIPRALEAAALRYDLSPLAIQTLREKRVLVICPLQASRRMSAEILRSVGMIVAATSDLETVASNYVALAAGASSKLGKKADAQNAALNRAHWAVPSFDLVLCDLFDPHTYKAEIAQLVHFFTQSTHNVAAGHFSDPTPGLLCMLLPLHQTSPLGVSMRKLTSRAANSRLFLSASALLDQGPVQQAPTSTRSAVASSPKISSQFMARSSSAPQQHGSSLNEVQEENVGADDPFMPSPPTPLVPVVVPATAVIPLSTAPPRCGLLELHKPLKTSLLLQVLAAHLANVEATATQSVSAVSKSQYALSEYPETPGGSLIFSAVGGLTRSGASTATVCAASSSSHVPFTPVLPDYIGPAAKLPPLSLPRSGPCSAATSPTGATAASGLSPFVTILPPAASSAAPTPTSLSSSLSTSPSVHSPSVTLLSSGHSIDTSAMASPASRSRTLRSAAASPHAMSLPTALPSPALVPGDAASAANPSTMPRATSTGAMSKSHSSNRFSGPLLASVCPLNVLLVDDNPINLKMLSMVLRKQGYTCDTAANGQIACEKVQAKWDEDQAAAAASASAPVSYDLIVMDVCMDVMDGLECMRWLRGHQPADFPSTRPFIIAHTADSTPESKAGCAAAGAECFLPKPFHQDQLINFIKQAYAEQGKRKKKAEGGAQGKGAGEDTHAST